MEKAATQHPKHFPWLVVSLGIAGLIIGYGLMIGKQNITFANGYSCPATCHGNNCANLHTCTSGQCSKECPGNCNHQS